MAPALLDAALGNLLVAAPLLVSRASFVPVTVALLFAAFASEGLVAVTVATIGPAEYDTGTA